MCDASQNLDNQFYQMDLIIDASDNAGLDNKSGQQTGDDNHRQRLSLLGNQEHSPQQLKIGGNTNSNQRFTPHHIENQKSSNGNSSDFINSLKTLSSASNSLHDAENRNSTKNLGN